jgi:hypothetical protein
MYSTIRELIDALENEAQSYGDDARVRVAFQPGYPLAASVANVIHQQEMPEDPDGALAPSAANVIWIAVTEGTEYGPAGAWS